MSKDSTYSDHMRNQGLIRKNFWMSAQDWQLLDELLRQHPHYSHPGDLVSDLLNDKKKKGNKR